MCLLVLCIQPNIDATCVFYFCCWPYSVVQLGSEWLACSAIEPLQWIALAWSTSVQKANPQKAGLLHNAPTGQLLQLAQTSRTTMVPLKLASVGLHVKLLYWSDSCLSAVRCLWKSCWPRFRRPPGFPLYRILCFFFYYTLHSSASLLLSLQSHCIFFFSSLIYLFSCIFILVCVPLLSASHVWPAHFVAFDIVKSQPFAPSPAALHNTDWQYSGWLRFYRQRGWNGIYHDFTKHKYIVCRVVCVQSSGSGWLSMKLTSPLLHFSTSYTGDIWYPGKVYGVTDQRYSQSRLFKCTYFCFLCKISEGLYWRKCTASSWC